MPPEHLRDRQAGFNASSRGMWSDFAGHRREVMGLLGQGGGRLGILGAGNGNDLDLPTLLDAWREVHLIDLDAPALRSAAERQGIAGHPRLRMHGGLDVTGRLDVIGGWSPGSEIRPSDLVALAGWPAGRVAPLLPGGFDLVVSTCLISQLMETCRHALGPSHPSLGAVERAVLSGHLRLLARLARPGGSAVLVTEVASSAAVPGLGDVPEAEWPALMDRLGREGTHYRWLHPSQLIAAVRDDAALAMQLGTPTVSRPWMWRVPTRTYLVAAIVMRVADLALR